MVKDRPNLSLDDAVLIARQYYGLHAAASPLPSYQDQNFILRTPAGEKYVLKIAGAGEERALLEAQNQAMNYLEGRIDFVQRVLPAKTNERIVEMRSPDGRTHLARLLTYLPGKPLARVRRHSAGQCRHLGEQVALLDRALSAFDHPALHRNLRWDLAKGVQVIEAHIGWIEDRAFRALVEQILADFQQRDAPRLSGLRHGVIHNDANDYNVLVGGGEDLTTRGQRVVGIIDFGDMVYTYTVGGLAIAIAYAILGEPDPLGTAIEIVRGYHAVSPLDEQELSVLFGLARLRLCVSACLAAYQKRQGDLDPYVAISQGPIREALPRLAQISPRFADAAFRSACGLVPVPEGERLARWLQAQSGNFASLLGGEPSGAAWTVFDLSVGSALTSGDAGETGGAALARRMLLDHMRSGGAQFGAGRYAEARLHESARGAGFEHEPPSFHLGMDLFGPAGAAVCAPLAGVVKAVRRHPENKEMGGSSVILQHQAGERQTFYTLYANLDDASLERLAPGQEILAGEPFAAVARGPESSAGMSFVRFQILVDLLDMECDFPAFCRPSQAEIWKQFSLDPNLILRIPATRFPGLGLSKAETLAARRKWIGLNLSIGYKDPVKVVRGWMQYLYDERGRKYLDAYNNVPHVGHCHPRVVRAVAEQMGVLNTNTRYLHDNLAGYAERLAGTLPGPLRVCYFVNSGSEANELALRLARAHSRQRGMIVLEGAYHGHTTSLIDISPYKHDGPGGEGAPDWVCSVPVADVYRGPYKNDDPHAGEKYAQFVERAIQRLGEYGAGLAGFIAETCPSVGGQIIFPDNYLPLVYQLVRAAGGVCIADEVQTGYGRMGTHFYAFEAQGVVPDIVVLGKPIGNGYPLGAVITTPEIAASFDNGMEFFSTFGGSTVSCAAGLAVLQVVLEEDLQAHAQQVGEYLLSGLRSFQERFPLVGDVRGSGLFLGAELVRDGETLEPAGEEAAFICNRMRELGVLLGTDGPDHNVIKIRPPMPFSRQDADVLLGRMEKILEEDFEPD